MNRFLGQIVRVGVAAALLLSLAAPVSAADSAMVRVLHGSPDAPAVDVYLDDAKVSALTNVPFGVISGYLPVPAGDHNVKVYATGTTTTPVIDADVTLATGASYTIAATGPVASIAAQVLQDQPSPRCATAQVRVIHFSADAPAVDIATSGSAPADAVIKGLAYPNASGYLDLPGGSYDLEVRLAGQTTVALPLPGVSVAECSSYSVFAIGSAATPAVGGNALQVVVAIDGTSAASTPQPAAPALPETDALASDSTGPSGVLVLGLVVLAVLALTALLSRPFAARRVRQD